MRWAWEQEEVSALRDIGELLAYLRQPDPPKGMRDAWDKAPVLKQVLHMGPKMVRNPPCQYHAIEGEKSTSTSCRYRPAGPAMRRPW